MFSFILSFAFTLAITFLYNDLRNEMYFTSCSDNSSTENNFVPRFEIKHILRFCMKPSPLSVNGSCEEGKRAQSRTMTVIFFHQTNRELKLQQS